MAETDAHLGVAPEHVAMREFSALDRAAAAGHEAMRVALEVSGAEMLRERLARP